MMPGEYPLPSTLVKGGGKIPMITTMVIDEDRQDDLLKQQGERQATFHLAKSL